MELEKLISFSRLLGEFRGVERAILIPGTNRFENDMEHSFHLALMAWYIIDSRRLGLNLSLTLKYALAHDLVEVHAGDTYIYTENAEYLASKCERESAAAVKLSEDYPEFPDIHATIAAYERREDPESRFVYALDKVLPILMIREDGGRTWKERQVTLEMLTTHKKPKVALSPEIEPYFDELVELLQEENLTA